MFQVRIMSRAASDIDSIHEWIAAQHPENAERFRGKILKAIRSLRIMPRAHPVAPDGLPAGGEVRHIVVWPYRIIYEIIDNFVLVHHVRHGSRLPAQETE